MEKRRFKQNENGAVLLTVLCVMLMMIILVGASISFVSQTTQKTYRTFQAEQAYMTATTCLETYVNDIELKTLDGSDQTKQKKAIDDLVALSNDNGGNGYEYDVLINGDKDIEKMGSCTIRVSKFNDQTIVITATAKFGSETDQVAAYVQTDTQPRSASFSNAIEICKDTGGMFDNTLVLGDYATITGNDKSKDYTIRNAFTTNGSYIVFGNVTAKASSNILLRNGLSDSSEGGKVQIWGDFYAENIWKVRTKVVKANTSDDNYMLVKGTFKAISNPVIGNYEDGGFEKNDEPKTKRTNRYEVDVFCETFDLAANEYHQLGNLVVSGKASSKLILNGTNVEIYGDVLVDGTIEGSANTIVHGDVYCTGSIPANVKVVGQGNAPHPNCGSIPTNDRYKVPEMSDTYNEYEYMPEDLIANPTSTIGVLKSKYDALHNTGAKTVKDLYDEQFGSGVTSYSYTNNGTKVERVSDGGNHIRVTDSTGTQSDYAMVINKSCTLGNDLSSQLYNVTKQHKILIHVTTEDIVILLKQGSGLADAGETAFIVKNDSSSSSPKFCYFVTDAGKTVNYDTESNREKNQKVAFDLQKSTIMDYDLYKVMYESSVLTSYSSSLLNGKVKDNFSLNLTDGEVKYPSTDPKPYKPADEKIIYLVTNGSLIKKRQPGFHEGIIYGPEGTYESMTQSYIKIPKIYMSTEDNTLTNVALYSLGMIITGSFNNDNTSYYAFNQPDANSALSIVKKSKNSQLSGYKLVRYEHH